MMGHIRKAIMKLTSVIIVIAVTFITFMFFAEEGNCIFCIFP